MSTDSIRVPEGLTTEGLLGRRYMARFLDSVFTLLLVGVIVTIADLLVSQDLFESSQGVILPLLFLLAWLGYGNGLESSRWQATLGKRIAGLRVYDAQGGRLTLHQAAARTVVEDGPFAVFSTLPFGQPLAWMWLLAHVVVLHRSPVYQAIHDRVAKTWVAAPEETIRLRLS